MLDKIRRYRNTLTIKRKLLFINIAIAILPVVIFALLITQVYENAVDKRTKQSVGDSSVVIADRITRILKDTENCSNYLTVNINKVMGKKDTNKKMTLAEQKAVTNELYVAKIVFDEIDSIAFINANHKVFVSDNTLLTNTDSIITSEQMAQLEKTSGKSIWFPSEARDFLVKDTTVPVLTLGKKVLQINTGETLGYIFVNVDTRTIGKVLSNQLINYRLVSNEGNIISSMIRSDYIDETDMNQLIEHSDTTQVKRFEGRKYYVSSHEIVDYGWKLIGVTDMYLFNMDEKNIVYLIMVIAIAAIVLEILLSNYLSRIITVPLQRLKSGAEEIAGGNMKLRLQIENEDEIGQVGNSFNYMTEQVQELLMKVDYEARKKQEYELSLLHEQVKPHFLYNSLDIIIKLSEMNRHQEARRAIRKLADYYRNSLSDSKKIITISQEIRIVEDYLELQRIRYNDLFLYEVNIEDKIKPMLIPKLTLQPLIENAIYHGLKYKEKTGMLRITGRSTEEGIILTVEDNGVGMKEEDSEALLANKPEGHFGVYSVSHRIKLFFGEKYGIKVRSEPGEGTMIEIILPERKSMEGLEG